MKQLLNKFFKIPEHGSTISRETIAGFTTFLTVAYIIVVNPAILAAAGIPREASIAATIYTAAIGTFLMGFYANRPFVIAPYMGENAFIAYTVVKVLGYSWQTALGAVFIGGILFVALTVLKVRQWVVEAIPASLKFSFVVGLGLFLTIIGLVDTGIVVPAQGAPLQIGNITEPSTLLAILCFIVMSILMARKIKGALILGILGITVIGYAFQVTPMPSAFISSPPDISPIFLQLDIKGALTWGFFSVILTVFIMDFVDTMGTLIGVSARAGFLDDKGNLPEIEKPMMCDAIATVSAALLGTSTAGTFIESATGVEEGGRTGLTAVVAGLLFLLGLFFAPFLTSIPKYAYGPALILVGSLMISSIKKIDLDDFTELFPAFCTIVLMCFTYNLGIGITAGFIVYPIMKVVTGRAREIHPGMIVLFVMSLLFYIFYPYS